jgi:hypothetical protein
MQTPQIKFEKPENWNKEVQGWRWETAITPIHCNEIHETLSNIHRGARCISHGHSTTDLTFKMRKTTILENS